jgi:formate dehydrogenase major subunit
MILFEKDKKKKIRAFYVMGEDPAQSDSNLNEMQKAFEALEFLVVQDIFMNKTATYADVVLPATSWGEHEGLYTCSDRGFQRHRKAIEPPEGTKTDWDIICQISTAMGYPMKYENTKEIWDEVRSLCPSFKGATYEKIEEMGSLQWPCRDESKEDKGTPILHVGKFTTADGLGIFHAADYIPPGEEESDEYPFSLNTVREVGHYSARTMTGNCRALVALEDEPGYVQMNPQDCQRLGIKDRDLLWVKSKRGKVFARCWASDRIKPGDTCMTYQWWIGACNELTTSFKDPIAATPEYKYCAVNIEKIDDQAWAEDYLRETYIKIKTDMRVDEERRYF